MDIVLICDPDKRRLSALTEIVQKAESDNIEPVHTDTADEVKEQVQEIEPDYVFLPHSFSVGKETGLDLVKDLEGSSLVVSVTAMPGDAPEYQERGIVHFGYDPFSRLEFAEFIQTQFGYQTLHDVKWLLRRYQHVLPAHFSSRVVEFEYDPNSQTAAWIILNESTTDTDCSWYSVWGASQRQGVFFLSGNNSLNQSTRNRDLKLDFL